MPPKSTKVETPCQHCEAVFRVLPSRIAAGSGKYCSNECRRAARRMRIDRTCPTCGAAFETLPVHVRNGGGKFCSVPCRVASHGTTEDRFWSKVNRNGPVPLHRPELGQCWEWTANRNASGYGQFRLGQKMVRAHRTSWVLLHGPITDDRHVCHACDNPSCVRPDHLFLGDRSDNMSDMTAKGRHPYPTGDDHPHRRNPAALPRGEQNGYSRLTDEAVRSIRREYASGKVSQDSLAQRFGVSQVNISQIIRRKTWTHIE